MDIINHYVFNPNRGSFGFTKRENLVNFLKAKVVYCNTLILCRMLFGMRLNYLFDMCPLGFPSESIYYTYVDFGTKLC